MKDLYEGNDFFEYWKTVARLLNLDYDQNKSSIDLYKGDYLVAEIQKHNVIILDIHNTKQAKNIIANQLKEIINEHQRNKRSSKI